MSSLRRDRRLALGILVAVLALGCWLSSPPSFRRARTRPVEGWVFFSPNTLSGLTLDQSLRRLGSPEHDHGRRIVPRLLEDLGLPRAKVHDAIGDWPGGVENAVLVEMPATRDLATLRCAAAWLALTCRQQAVLLFRDDPRGVDCLTTITADASIDHFRQQLDRHGIRERTIVVRAGSCKAIVVDPAGRQQVELERAARSLHGEMTTRPGRCETLAGSTPHAATRRYRDVMWTWRVSAVRR